MSKGSTRRPRQVKHEEYSANWERVFRKPGGLESTAWLEHKGEVPPGSLKRELEAMIEMQREGKL